MCGIHASAETVCECICVCGVQMDFVFIRPKTIFAMLHVISRSKTIDFIFVRIEWDWCSCRNKFIARRTRQCQLKINKINIYRKFSAAALLSLNIQKSWRLNSKRSWQHHQLSRLTLDAGKQSLRVWYLSCSLFVCSLLCVHCKASRHFGFFFIYFFIIWMHHS